MKNINCFILLIFLTLSPVVKSVDVSIKEQNIIAAKIEVLKSTKTLLYGEKSKSFKEILAVYKNFEIIFDKYQHEKKDRSLLNQDDCNLFYSQFEKNMAHLHRQIQLITSHTLSSMRRNYSYSSVKTEALIYALQFPLQLATLNNELGRYKTVKTINSCTFTSYEQKSRYLKQAQNVINEATQLLASIHGKYGLLTSTKNLQDASKEAIGYYKRETFLLIPKIAATLAITRYGGAWLGSALAMHSIMNNPVEIPELSDMEPEKIRATLREHEILMDQDEDSFSSLIDFTSQFRQVLTNEILAPTYRDLIEKYPFINRMVKAHQTLDGAINHLEKQLKPLSN